VDESSDPEVSPLAPRAKGASGPSRARPHGRLSAVLHARWLRLLLTTLALGAAVICLLGQMIPDAWQRASATLFPPVRTATPTATPVIPTPQPAMGILAPPPTDCPASPPLDSVTAQPENFRVPVTMYGRSPVWMAQGYWPQGPVYVGTVGTPIPYPERQIIWEVGPTTYPNVTARATDLRTGELAWWTGGSPRPQVPVLSFQPRVSGAGPAFGEMLSDLILTHAGCYKLDVTWQGGEWSSIFAVGGRTST
jgi:hypothetical protein